jgi:hypothetical protein
MTARKHTLTGTLTIFTDHAEFEGKGQLVRFQPVLEVLIGRRGSDFFNRWIELHYGGSDDPSTVYLSDSGWLGWRPILTGSNRRMLGALRSLTPAPPG